MSLTPEQVKQIAHLARLELPEAQLGAYAGQLSSIFELVDQLQAADVGDTAPMAHPLDMAQRLRPDAVTETDRRDDFQAIAPAVQDGLYRVPRVIE
jgi:aspartyl-tRNA(Asn)/glutamyl-tRNA(Gln) amidotransferase subunit C